MKGSKKKTKPQSMGHWKGISCNPLTQAGNNFALPFGLNFMLAPSLHPSSTLPSCLQLFAPAQVALLGLAQLEAQLVLNQLSNIAINHNGYCNPLPSGMLHTYQSQHTVPVSLCQPPRALYPLTKTSHATCNPASDKVCHQMSTGSFPSDKLETASSKNQSGTGMMAAPQEQEQTPGSHLEKDEKVNEAPPATFCNHQEESQKSQALPRSSVHTPATQHTYKNKYTRNVPAAATSRNTSREAFEYVHTKRNSERRKSPRGLACSKRYKQSWAYRDKSQSGWYEDHSLSPSISPSPSWSPSPPPLSHKRSSQSPHSSDRYSPSDLIHGCSSSEHRSSKRTREFSSADHFCKTSLKNRQGDLIKQNGGAVLPFSFSSYKSSDSSNKQHVPTPDLNGKGNFRDRNVFSSFSVGDSVSKYPSFKVKRKVDHHTPSSLHTTQQTSAQTAPHKTKDIIKNEKSSWASVMSQSSKNFLNAAHLVCLSGIPAEAKYQDVCRCLAPFGVIKELVFLPELDKLSQAFLHMLKQEDAEELAKCQNLTICNKVITVVRHHQKGVIHISGIPFDYSEDDLIKLVTPFGQPIKILIATEVDMVNGLDCRMALVVLPNELSAINIVKVYSVVPVHLRKYDLTLVPQVIDFSSPVSLFQAFTAPRDPSGSITPWEHLLVVSNVPDQPHIATELMHIVQPFGKVLRTLVLPEEKATDASDHHCIKMVLEMMSSVNVSLACDWFQKTRCLFYNHHLCFSVGTKPHLTNSGVADNRRYFSLLHFIELHWSYLSKSCQGLVSEENCKCHDLSPWIHESVEGTVVFISGFSATMNSEDDFIQMAAPHGVPTKVIIAMAQRKALVEFPEKHSAKKMVAAYNAIPIGLKQLDMKLLPDTADINKPGKATDPLLLLTACNVPSTVSAISQVQQLVQRYGTANRTLILNNMVIFEMITSNMAKLAYEQLKKLPRIVHRSTLSFVWGSDLSVPAKRMCQLLSHRESLLHTAVCFSVYRAHLEVFPTRRHQEDGEDLPFDLHLTDLVSVDEVADVPAFQKDDIPLPVEPFTSTQPNHTFNTGDVKSIDVIEELSLLGEKWRQPYDRREENKCQRNQKRRKRCKEQQAGTKKKVPLTSPNISGSQMEGENQVKVQRKTKPLDVTVGLMHRRLCVLHKAKTFLKKINTSRPVFPGGYCLVPFNPECPVGTEFLEQKSSFFCKVCRKFSIGDEEVRDMHCRSFRHYQNLERCLQNWLQKRSCSEQDKQRR